MSYEQTVENRREAKFHEKESTIDFIDNKNDNQKFLIHIVNKQIYLNEVKHMATFFKDITFGVLFEQIKA